MAEKKIRKRPVRCGQVYSFTFFKWDEELGRFFPEVRWGFRYRDGDPVEWFPGKKAAHEALRQHHAGRVAS